MLSSLLNYQQMKQNIDINLIQPHTIYEKSFKNVEKCKKKQPFKQFNPNLQTIPRQQHKNKKCLAYILDSEQQRYKLEISQIHERNEEKQNWEFCSIHKININSYHFCVDCYSYKLCLSCLSSNEHRKHTILSFDAQKQAKSFTKQFLIQRVEQSLNRLKGQQNQIKNRANEIDLMLKKVHQIQSQLVSEIQQTFSSIQKQIREIYESQEKVYISSIEEFYRNFNKSGDELRESLLSIIEESFNIKDFTLSFIDKMPPSIPYTQIDKFKAALEKTKKFNKIMLEQLKSLKQKGKQLIYQYQKLRSHKNIKSNISVTLKYQKFLTDNCYANQNQNKSSLLKILDTLSPY